MSTKEPQRQEKVHGGGSVINDGSGRSVRGSASFVTLLRRVPRVVWLASSMMVLVLGALVRHWEQKRWTNYTRPRPETTFLSKDWWIRPSVSGSDSALPEISGRFYGVAVQRPSGQDQPRIWVVGPGGLLLYSDDDAQCWNRFEYKGDLGEFRLAESCKVASAILFHWPELVPVFLAGEAKKGAEQKNIRSLNEQQQSPASRQTQQQGKPSDDPKASVAANQDIFISARSIHFGNISLRSSRIFTKELIVRNDSKAQVNLYVGRFEGDRNGEFSLKQKCESRLLMPGGICSFEIVLVPKEAGQKLIKLEIRSSMMKVPAVVTIDANVHDTPSNQPPPDVNRKPPLSAPDLLAIEFTPDGKIVSTGGLLWTLTNQNTWRFEQMSKGARHKVSGLFWIMEGSPADKWATETRVENPLALNLGNKRFRCEDCTIRSESPDPLTRTIWAAGWAGDNTGDHAILLRSLDTGRSWEPRTRGALSAENREMAASKRPWLWPPNWYWAVLLLTVLLGLPALLRPLDKELEKDPDKEASSPAVRSDGVEGRLSSDKPLDPGDVDVLGLTSIALGLSRFLRNEKTLPPLTIAVNGEWGSGKSSLMNLLRCDLKSYGMRPVWFNAWHHQKEEHLLAALLQTVRLEAVPSWWDPIGLPFRLHLLSYRLRRRWPLLVVLAAFAIFLIALDYHLRLRHHSDLFLMVTQQWLPLSKQKEAEPVSTLPIQGGILALFATTAALWKGLTALGTNPAALLASVAKGNKMSDLDAQTSFRQKFAVEFREFTRALGPRRPLVVFIDDLDRCLPGNVRELLEAVNFLVSSGDCFIILGIDRVQVQRAIGLSFKDVAEEAGGKKIPAVDDDPRCADEAARQKRAEFAQKYLEKLINLEVRIPTAIDDVTRQRLFEYDREKKTEPLPERLLRWVLLSSRKAIPALFAGLLLYGAARLSTIAVPTVEQWMNENMSQVAPNPATREQKNRSSKQDASSATSAEPRVKGQPDVDVPIATKGVTTGQPILPLNMPAPTIFYGRAIWPALWFWALPLYILALLLLLIGNAALTIRPGVVTHDSQPFTDALQKVWYPLVLAKQNTPRSAKRFVNRVRYLAMRQRGYQERASWWERSLFPQRLKEPTEVTARRPIPEPLLVALAAIEQLEPQWIYDQTAFTSVVNDGIEGLRVGLALPQAIDLLQQARTRHKEVFSEGLYVQIRADWNSMPVYRDTFVAIWPKLEIGELV